MATGAKWLLTLASILFVIGLAGHYLLTPGHPPDRSVEADEIGIYVADNGIHTTLILPARTPGIQWTEFIPPKRLFDEGTTPPQYRFVEFGWGDRHFYIETPTWSDLDVWTGLRALLWPTSSVVYVGGLREAPARPKMQKIALTPSQYRDLAASIKRSFKVSPKGAPIRVAPGYFQNDTFFASSETYHLFNTCNARTAYTLRQADLSMPWFPLFSSAIMRAVKRPQTD